MTCICELKRLHTTLSINFVPAIQLEAFRKQKALAKASRHAPQPASSIPEGPQTANAALRPLEDAAVVPSERAAELPRAASLLPVSTPAIPFNYASSTDEEVFFMADPPASLAHHQPLNVPNQAASPPATTTIRPAPITFMSTDLSHQLASVAPSSANSSIDSNTLLRPVPYKSRLPPPPPVFKPPTQRQQGTVSSPPLPNAALRIPPPATTASKPHSAPASAIQSATASKPAAESSSSTGRRLPPPFVPFQPVRKTAPGATSPRAPATAPIALWSPVPSSIANAELYPSNSLPVNGTTILCLPCQVTLMLLFLGCSSV